MSFGSSSYGTVPFGSSEADSGVPIIPEVTEATTTLVFVVEIDCIVRPED